MVTTDVRRAGQVTATEGLPGLVAGLGPPRATCPRPGHIGLTYIVPLAGMGIGDGL